MKKKTISRRECFTLLGAGAATILSAKVAPAWNQTGNAPGQQEIQPLTSGALPAVVSAWEELSRSSRIYDSTPVQARSEYQGGHAQGQGWQISLDGDWELVEADELMPPGEFPERGWTTVKMPRPIQYALMEAGKVPNLWYGDNYKGLRWIQERDWYLRRRFTIPEAWASSTIRLRFDGMDYRGIVWLNGEFLGAHEGAFGGPTFEVTKQLALGKEHELTVRLLHETHDLLPNYFGISDNHKPRVVKPDAQDAESYEWGNRYRTMGLYQPVRLVATGEAYIEAPFVRTDVLEKEAATLWAQAMVTNTGAGFEGVVAAEIVELDSGNVVWREPFRQKVPAGITFWERSIPLKNPRLWWPNGLGEQPLYRLELKLLKEEKQLDAVASRFGVRTLELKRNPVTPDSPRITPKDATLQEQAHDESLVYDSRGGGTLEDEAYEFLWVANGKPFYAKGACWLASDDVLLLNRQREEWMLRAARLNGFNLLRLNGGAEIFETEQFYNLCDEQGLIVWQEGPLDWIDSPGTTSIDVWREQLTQSALRLRQHPSLGIYVAGNEFDPFGNGIEPMVGMIREIFAGYDSSRPFRMNSPVGCDVHAYHPIDIWVADENWYHKVYDRGTCFVSEWSFASFANMSLFKRIIPAAELQIQPVGYDVEVFKRRYPTIRDCSAELNFSFVKSWIKASWYGDLGKANIEELVEYSQMGHENTIGCVFEQWRAQFPYTGGQTVWTYNSLGPIGLSWAIIDWFGQPQIPYYAAKRANEPVHVMADTGFFSWGPGDTFHASVFALNDGERPIERARVTARILDRTFKPVHNADWEITVPAGGVMSKTHDLSWAIPANTPESYFFLELTLADSRGKRLSRWAHWLRVLAMLADPAARKSWQSAPVEDKVTQTGPWLKPQIEALATTLEAEAGFLRQSAVEAEIVVKLRNTGSLPAYPVRIEVVPDLYSAVWTDNYFWLAPQESVTVTGAVRLDMTGLDPVARPKVARREDLALRLSAWNAPAIQPSLSSPA